MGRPRRGEPIRCLHDLARLLYARSVLRAQRLPACLLLAALVGGQALAEAPGADTPPPRVYGDGGLLSEPKYSGTDHRTQWSLAGPGEREDLSQASRHASGRGWRLLRSGDPETAMRRFNQAWTLDETNPEALWGMAIVQQERAAGLGPAQEPADRAERTRLVDSSLSLLREAIAADEPDPAPPLLSDAVRLLTQRARVRRAAGAAGADEDLAEADRLLTRAEAAGDHPQLREDRAELQTLQDAG